LQRLNHPQIFNFSIFLGNRIGYSGFVYAFRLIRFLDGASMSTFDIIFWVLIILIGVLAYAIESGLSARHRTLVFSSILSATLAVIYMLFLVEDNSKFGSGERPATAKKEKQGAGGGGGIGGGGGAGAAGGGGAEEGGAAGGAGAGSGANDDGALLKKAGGFRDCPACPLMTVISQGSVTIGSPADESGRRVNEGPQKVVRIGRSFAITRYEIQFREFAAFVSASRHSVRATCLMDGKPSRVSWQKPGYEQKTGDHPLVCVSRNDVNAYAAWLSKKTDRTYRLLSESEWEYAARAGTSTPYVTGASITKKQANFAGNGTKKSGSFSDSPFKVFDMNGNVWEMVDDCWSDDLSRIPSSGVSERGQGDCARSPIRGGSWNSAQTQLRSAYRRPMAHDEASNEVGIRLARDLK
jgi:formylglycine-generating enzyme required for sulfatase activity